MPIEATAHGCQEARLGFPGYIPCNDPATTWVGWIKRGEGPYRMCEACAHHNLKNRGADELGPFTPGVPAPTL